MKMPTNNYNRQGSNPNHINVPNLNFSQKMWFTLGSLISIGCASLVFFFSFVNPSYDEEAALKMRPIFFGSTRVDNQPINSITLIAPTTTAIYFNILPQKKQFQFDDLLSNDNTPLDVNMYMIIQVKKGQTPSLLRNYGEQWFENFIEPYFRNKVREYVSSCSPFDLMSNREVLSAFDNKIKQSMRMYVNSLSRKANFPIDIQQVITDRVMPNKEQLEEISPSQFIQLRAWDVIEKKQGANIDVLFGGGETPMWNIRRK